MAKASKKVARKINKNEKNKKIKSRSKSKSRSQSSKRSVKRKDSIERRRKDRKASSSERGKEMFKHLPSKRQRQYEHVKESELKRGKNEKIAKRIAAATVK